MGILSGNQQDEPMHYGEVFAVWSSLAAAQSQQTACEVYYNHAGDDDLKQFISDMVQDVVKPSIKETEQLLKVNEVTLPPAPPERADASRQEIPQGARILDPEISAALAKDITTGLVADSQIIGQATREDIAALFARFHMEKVQMGQRLLRINKEKGWLLTPPLHVEKVKQ
ncbi:MAG TPA: DUF3231 family protein [Bacillales bacterium]|nr:DUF3231 family protein [Bacillales bacterium]